MENPKPPLQLDPELIPIKGHEEEASYTIEPEMEDFTDEALLRNLAKELGIEQNAVEVVDPLKHNEFRGRDCVHCKIVNKISGLQEEISKMNQEISATNEILQLKQEQNSDLKGMISRLEENLGKSKDDEVVDKNSVNCSCMSKCIVA